MRNLLMELKKLSGSLFLGMLCLCLFTISAAAATYQVTNTADSGTGSLRQAVADANASAINDAVNFSIPTTDPNCNPSGVCTITLTGGVIVVPAAGGTLTIFNQTGAGKLLISGNNANRVFEVSQNANLTIDGVTVTQGISSGGLGVVTNSLGTLTILNSVFNQNSGSYVIFSHAFQTSGVLNVINTTVDNNTAIGIYATNELTIGGTANISNSTVSNNAAMGSAGGNGGGIYFLGSQMTITNSTVSGNSNFWGGGIFGAMGTVTLTNCTVTGNAATGSGGGGILSYQSTVKLRNTIVAGNTSSSGMPDFNFPSTGNEISLGNNLIGNSTNVGMPHASWVASDILNQPAQLAPLDNYGGATKTHALLSNSPAINAGANCVLTANGCGDNNPAVPTDQRGATRVATVDIGAFERAARFAFDFDGDGVGDISVFRPSNGAWYLLQSNAGFTGVQFGISSDVIVPADYDGDGKTDIAVYRSGTWYLLRSALGFTGVTFGDPTDIPQPADFDGDGKAELAVFRPSVGTWYVYNLVTNQPSAVQFGVSTDKPVVGDYDGDGKADYAVYRDGTWYLQRSALGFTAIAFGVSTDKPVVGDYDGDGKADVAVFRPSSGVWYVQQSTAGFMGVQFGTAADVPVPADYDGDRKTEVAVFRDGAWYQLRSAQGFVSVQFGTTNDKPIPNAFVP